MTKDIGKLTLGLDKTVLDALTVIQAQPEKIVFIVDEKQRLKGTITDGDIRRGLLDGHNTQSGVQQIMNTSPRTCTREVDEQDAQYIMQTHDIRGIPVLDKDGRLIDFHILVSSGNILENETPVIIMAGGRGERLLPLTENTPKPLIKVGHRPILETILDSFIQSGFKNFFFSVNYKADVIKSYFGDGSKWGVTIAYLEEEKFLGTVGSLSMLEKNGTLPLIVMNGDLLTKVDFPALLAFHRKSAVAATVCVREHTVQIPYGVVSVKNGQITDIVEKPVHRTMVNAAVYVLDPDCLNYIPDNQYFDMPSLLKSLLENNRKVGSFPIHEYWLDIGRLEDLQRAQEDYLADF